jgi:hypothetical protein
MRSSSAREPNYYRRPAVLRATRTWLSRPFVGIADCANPYESATSAPSSRPSFPEPRWVASGLRHGESSLLENVGLGSSIETQCEVASPG